MLKFAHLKMIARGWWRGGLSTVISLVSLTAGLLCSTILLLFTVEEFRVADSLTTSPNTYMMEEKSPFTNEYERDISVYQAQKLVTSYPEITDHTIIMSQHGTWMNDKTNNTDYHLVIGAQENITKLVNIPMLEGSLEEVVKSTDKIAITRSWANQLFPDQNPIGQTITGETGKGSNINGKNMHKTFSLTVTAIIDDSQKSFLKTDGIYGYNIEDYIIKGAQTGSYYVVMQLRDTNALESLCEKMGSDTTENKLNKVSIKLTPLNEAYFSEGNKADQKYSVLKSREKSTLLIGLAISLTVLVIAAFNYINLTLTRAPRRLKNLAGQRIIGASKWSIRWQVLLDTTLNVAIAIVCTLGLMEPAMLVFNSFMNSTLTTADLATSENALYLTIMIALLILLPSISLIAKLTTGNPLTIFKNPRGTKVHTMQTLTIAQMVISIILIAFSINVSRQMNFVTKNIQDASQIITVRGGFKLEFIDHLKTSASTISLITGSINVSSAINSNGFTYLSDRVEPGFFEFFKIPFIEGRTFDSVINDKITPVVVNESYVRKREIDGSAIGVEIEKYEDYKYRIVGVCEDFVIGNAQTEIMPVLYEMRDSRKDYHWQLNIRFTGSMEDKIAEIKQLYKEFGHPESEPMIGTIEDFYKDLNPEIVRMKTMVEFLRW